METKMNAKKWRHKLSAITITILLLTLLTACSNRNSESISPTIAPIQTSEPEPQLEIFEEDGKYGLRIGDEIVADAIWQLIFKHTTTDGSIFEVKLNDQYGLMDKNGQLILEPTYAYCHFYNDKNYAELVSSDRDATESEIYSLIKRQVVATVPKNSVDKIIKGCIVYKCDYKSEEKKEPVMAYTSGKSSILSLTKSFMSLKVIYHQKQVPSILMVICGIHMI